MLHDSKNKPVVFMLSAALGCLIAAVLAEAFLLALPKGEPIPSQIQAVCLTIDVSGSMEGAPMREMKAAAKRFVDKRSGDDLAITIFSSNANVLVPFTQNSGTLKRRIDDIEADGATNFEAALRVSAEVLAGAGRENDRILLIFTDGENTVGNENKAIQTAQQLRRDGVRIFSVATDEADVVYLEKLTGDEDRVIYARSGELEDAFDKAEKMIGVATTIGNESASYTIAFIATIGWTVFVALGIALALVAIQNYFLKKALLQPDQAIWIITGAILAGIAAGIVAQTAMTILAAIHLGELGRILAWSALGSLLAFGMVFVIPNLDRTKALGFGALGGFLGSIGFLIVTAIVGNTGGRLLGAFILGACVGLLVAIVETVCRNLWLKVVYGPNESIQVNLGSQVVSVGSGTKDTVFIEGVGPLAGTFRLEGDKIRYTDSKGSKLLMPGNNVQIGDVTLVILSKNIPAYIPPSPKESGENQANVAVRK